MKAFNLAYYWKHIQRVRRGIVHPDAFFYPLDALDDWNLIYGRRGFTQYQCVLPHADDNGPARRFLELFVSGGGMGFLCVIKDCGAEGKGMLSFPAAGHVDRHGFSHPPHEDPRTGRSAQRIGDRRGGADLPDEGHVHPAGAFSRDGAAAGGVQRRAAQVGSASSASAAPNRFDFWETPHEGRAVGSEQRDGPGVGAAIGRPRRPAVSAGRSRAEELAISARDLEIRGAAAPVETAHCDLLRAGHLRPRTRSGPAGTGRFRYGRGHGRPVRRAGGFGETIRR